LPTPSNEDRSEDEAGIANGPTINANDCKTSDKLSPKMRRRYGEVNLPGDQMIAVAMKEEATKVMDALHICAYTTVALNSLSIVVLVVGGGERV
jgi:hypothetical protein